MTRMTKIKLALALLAAIVWAAGFALGNEVLRWVGIGILLVAVLLRFVKGGGNTGV